MTINPTSAALGRWRVLLAPAIALLLSATLSLAPAQAKVELAAEGAMKVLCAGDSKTKHPKRTELHHLVSANSTAAKALLVLQYESDDSGNPGLVTAEVELLHQDDSRKVLGELGMLTDGPTGTGVAANSIPADLDNAAAASWDIRFRKFKSLPARDCILVLGAVGAEDGE